MGIRRDDRGFTLIELLVVVFIIGILVTIAVPKFIATQGSAKQRAAQANLRTAESLASGVYANRGGVWAGATLAADLTATDKAFTWSAGSSTGPKEVGYHVDATGQVLTMTVRALSGDCYFTRIDNSGTGGTYYLRATGASCDAADGSLTFVETSNDRGWA